MTQPVEPNAEELWREELQTRHPGIADEIQGAINTLQKLQQITGTVVSEKPARAGADNVDPGATIDSPARPAADTDNTAKTPGFAQIHRSGGQNAVLAASDSFGRYQIVRVLGQGAMGAVYLAYDSQLERHVALKTPFLGDSPQIIARFYREARAAAQIRSPYICPIYDVGQIGDIYYLTMAFIDGQSLERATAAGKWKDHKAIADIVKKIARGLHKAHEQGIVHRDLKPENVMLDGDGDPIVMDFGVARRVDEDIQLSTPGRLIGTPAYMSPEQVEADPSKIGPATDIYSLGVVLYRMLTGRLPFQGKLTSVLRQIGNEQPPRPSALNPEIGEGSPLETVCLKMMAKAPLDRFPNMTDVAEALEQAFSGAAAPVAASSPRRSTWSWLFNPFASRTRAANGATPKSTSTPRADSGSMTVAE